MRILKTTYLIKAGAFGDSPEWIARRDQICSAIAGVEWPIGSGAFTLHARKQANGVVPIKQSCMRDLRAQGWKLETGNTFYALNREKARPDRRDVC